MKYDFLKVATERSFPITPFDNYRAEIMDILHIDHTDDTYDFLKADKIDDMIDGVLELFPPMNDERREEIVEMLGRVLENIRLVNEDLMASIYKKKALNWHYVYKPVLRKVQDNINGMIPAASVIFAEAILSVHDKRIEPAHCKLIL